MVSVINEKRVFSAVNLGLIQDSTRQDLNWSDIYFRFAASWNLETCSLDIELVVIVTVSVAIYFI